MRIGTLGNLVFQVSSETVQTIDDLQWSGSAQYSTHQRHLGKGLLEFTGVDPDDLSFSIFLSRSLGVEPEESLALLRQYERNGTTLPFSLGSRPYGEYRWVIVSHKVQVTQFDGRGRIAAATVSVSLREYIKE